VVSAYHHLTQEKGEFAGPVQDFIENERLGLGSWIAYMNGWAPQLLQHRDSVYIAYGEMDHDPARVLNRVLEFIGEEPDPELVINAVVRSQALRSTRKIRTGQEGNFWDHLQPEAIFEIQERIQTGLSDAAVHLLNGMGVELDPFPRSDEFEI
jgi:hypothetical protein